MCCFALSCFLLVALFSVLFCFGLVLRDIVLC